jgi:ParB family chromosome partitioning protein
MSGKIVLGKGLEALIPTHGEGAANIPRYQMVPLERIAPNPMQPRRDFDEATLKELADSFKLNGILQPLAVRPNGSTFTIIAGERRFRAARLAGLKEVPVVLVADIDNTRMLELALVENLQREDLNPLEAAEAYRRLIDECHLTQNELAEKIGKSRTAVANSMRLLGLPEEVKAMIRDGRLTEGHARAILAVEGAEARVAMAERIVSQSLSVRDAEEVTRKPKPRRRRGSAPMPSPEIAEIENNLKRLFGTAVKLHYGLKKGRIEIEYYGDDDLDRILQLFARIES